MHEGLCQRKTREFLLSYIHHSQSILGTGHTHSVAGDVSGTSGGVGVGTQETSPLLENIARRLRVLHLVCEAAAYAFISLGLLHRPQRRILSS